MCLFDEGWKLGQNFQLLQWRTNREQDRVCHAVVCFGSWCHHTWSRRVASPNSRVQLRQGLHVQLVAEVDGDRGTLDWTTNSWTRTHRWRSQRVPHLRQRSRRTGLGQVGNLVLRFGLRGLWRPNLDLMASLHLKSFRNFIYGTLSSKLKFLVYLINKVYETLLCET